MKKYLNNFVPYIPPFELDQNKSIEWLKKLHQSQTSQENCQKINKLFNMFGISEDKISQRRTFLKDFANDSWEENELIKEDNTNPDMNQRSQIAQNIFENIFDNLYNKKETPPDQILHISCTHYQSPSAAQLLATKKKWNEVPVTHLYHMGCYAALPAIRTASALVADGNNRVDINHTEMCSLHFDAKKNDPQQAIVQTLFSDGAIHYQLSNQIVPKQTNFEILSQHEVLIDGSAQEMKWMVGNRHFDMSLSKNVPALIQSHIDSFFQQLFAKADLDFYDLKKSCEFAIHPGGPKIIDAVANATKLNNDQVARSLQILKSRGNMSSATLPHIWGKISEEPILPFVATVAFGPGLTVTGALFKVW